MSRVKCMSGVKCMSRLLIDQISADSCVPQEPLKQRLSGDR